MGDLGSIIEVIEGFEVVDGSQGLVDQKVNYFPDSFFGLEPVQEITIENYSLNFTGTEILVLYFLILSILVLAFNYVKQIDRSQGILPNFVHKLFCPVLSVLRWQGFEGEQPILAIIFGCFYTVWFWRPEHSFAKFRIKEKKSFCSEIGEGYEENEKETLKQTLLRENPIQLV